MYKYGVGMSNYRQWGLKMVDGRVSFEPIKIDRDIECGYCINSGYDNLELIRLLPTADVRVNPRRTKAPDLLRILESDNSGSSAEERFDFRKDFPEKYDFKWAYNEKEKSTNMTFVLVAYRDKAVVGFVNLGISLWFDDDEDLPTPPLVFTVLPRLVYVLKQERGKGYGLDLSVATGEVVCKLLTAIYESVQHETVISPMLSADIRTAGGRKFVEYLLGMLECEVDQISLDGTRESKVIADLLGDVD